MIKAVTAVATALPMMIRHNTIHAKEVVLALDKCGVSYFAKFSDSCIALTYDGSYADTVDEIIRKAQSDGYEQLMLKIRNKANFIGYKVLFPEISALLHTTVDTIKKRPDEVQENLCRTYVNLWFFQEFESCKSDTAESDCTEQKMKQDI